MPSPQQIFLSQLYRPAEVIIVGTRKHSLKKVALARFEAPDQVSGVAQRVGYTGKLETDLVVYRLRLRQSSAHPAVILPGFFVLEEGVFHLYQNASEDHQHER